MTSSVLMFNGFESESNPQHNKTLGLVFHHWLLEQELDMNELKTAAKDHSESTQYLVQLVDRVMSHYENYYRVKSESTKGNVLLMLNPTWLSNLESAFLWVGGCRPTVAFHLLYSASGKELEAELTEFLSGLRRIGDLGGLSPSQLIRVDELHRQTIRGEKELSEKLAAQQESVADSFMVELSGLVTESTLTESNSLRARIEFALVPKEHRLEEIVKKADDLRLKTLRNMLNILNPIQAVHLFTAAAQFNLRIHEWGMAQSHG